jgi:large subunit ribosomal protein L24
MKRLKVNDEVVVLAGKDKGKTGKVSKIFWKSSKVLVEGVNKIKKSSKPTQENPTGGFVDLEKALHISNVSLFSPKTKKPTRVKFEMKGDKKVRIAKKCGSSLN